MSATSHGTLAEALVAFQGEAPKFSKNKTAKVKSQRTGAEYTYKYADLADILPVVGPLLAAHGLSWSSKPGRADDGELVLRYRLLHASGEADGDEMPLGVDRNCKPQELGSAITYARRYALTAQLNLTTEEDDDGRTAQAATRPTRKPSGPPQYRGLVELATEEDIVSLVAAARGLRTAQVKTTFTACAVQIPPAFVDARQLFASVPRGKAAVLAQALSEVER